MKVEIKKGKELSNKAVREINGIWHNAFGSKPMNPLNRKRFSDDVFFILTDSKNKILSAGRLRPVKVKFLGEIYHILGIADIVSVIERKGYGKKIMTAIKKSLKDDTGVGFCSRKNASFYRKCGFKIAKNGMIRFVYRSNKKKNEEGEETDADVLYLKGKDDFIKKFLKNKKEIVKIYIPHW